MTVKPCATCRHPKSRHRAGYCTYQWTRTGQIVMGRSSVIKYCLCEGYVAREDDR